MEPYYGNHYYLLLCVPLTTGARNAEGIVEAALKAAKSVVMERLGKKPSSEVSQSH